jgi:hypothetical protein
MVELSKTTYTPQENIVFKFESSEISAFNQIQVEIFNTCNPNPKSVLGFGTSPERMSQSKYKVDTSAKNLKPGIYEVKIIKLHTPKNHEEGNEEINFFSNIHFPRTLFEVVEDESKGRDQSQLINEVEKWEMKNNEAFHGGISISNNKGSSEYAVFVMIKGLKIGINYKLDKYEFIPLSFGLQSLDELNATNKFLKENTRTNFLFEYSKQVDENSQRKDPVVVAHFPRIFSDDIEEARVFCEKRVSSFIESMSLIRGAVGEIFDFVVIDLSNGEGMRLSPSVSYMGNLLTGGLSGEQPESLSNYINSIETNDFHHFIITLHKEALRESNENYKILRYWSILEILAESKNYNTGKRDTELDDFDGKPLYKTQNGETVMDENNQPIIIREKNAIAIVYNLFKDEQWGNAFERLEIIRTWIALRDAVAHFGSIQNYAQLHSAKTRSYAEKAVNEINQTKGHNPIIWTLKEDVKLLLMRELNKNAL